MLILLSNRLYSTDPNFKKRRLTKKERSNFELDPYLKQVLLGNILGDVYLRKFSDKANTRVVFRQGEINKEYLLHLYDLFQTYVYTPPYKYKIFNKENNKERCNLSFATLALPCFNPYYSLFYSEGKKRIPHNIADYLTNVSLAYWIMDDGGFTGNGLKLYTNAYTLEDLSLLIEALNKNFQIKATIHKSSIENQYTLYISKNQMPHLINLVKDYMHSSMLYKLNIN